MGPISSVQRDRDDRRTLATGLALPPLPRRRRALCTRAAGPATTRGPATRWSGTRPRRRRHTTSTRCRRSRARRPLGDLRREAAGAACALSRARSPAGPVLRVTVSAAAAATAAVVVSAALGSGTRHWGAALVALPLLVRRVGPDREARLPTARSPPPRPRSALMLAAVATGGLVALSGDAHWAVASTSRAAAARSPPHSSRSSLSFRGEQVPLGPWRDYVTLTKPRIMSLLLLTGAAGMFVGAGGLAGSWAVRRDAWSGSRSPAAARAPSITSWTPTSTG